MAAKKAEQVLVEQVRSSNRSSVRWLHTLKALGLGRIGKKKVHTLTPPTEGMIRSVEHLVKVSAVE